MKLLKLLPPLLLGLCLLLGCAAAACAEESFTLGGVEVKADAKSVDLSGLTHEEAAEAGSCLKKMPLLEHVELGQEREGGPTWAEIRALEQAAPLAEFSYAFQLYGKSFTLQDEEMDLNHIRMKDEGELVREVIACMPRLRWLCMDSCKVSNEAMASLRDDFPEIEVVWRVNFGDCYTARTDVEKILASRPSVGGMLYSKELNRTICYCTKVRFLDLGHNWGIRDISFVSSMPELEVLIVAMDQLGDISPLADCPKLEYLEMFQTEVSDLSPLSELHELRHLNIGNCPLVKDLSPLYGLELERLYIGTDTGIPKEQIEEYRRLHPDCEVDDTAYDTSIGAWRYTTKYDKDPAYMAKDYYEPGQAPRFALLRVQFGYHGDNSDYAYTWKDPNY